MIDVNEKLKGDITHQLKPYSSKVHFEYALKAFKNWGQAIDP